MERDIHEAGFEEFNIRSQEAARLTTRAVQKQLALVRRLLQHSRAAVTQRYIGIESQRIEKAIEGHAELV